MSYLQNQEMTDIYNLSGDELVKLWWETCEIGKELYDDQSKWYWWHITHEGNGAAMVAKSRFGRGENRGRHRTALWKSIIQAKHFILTAQRLSA